MIENSRTVTNEELKEAMEWLMRIRGFSFQLVEAMNKSRMAEVGLEIPSATTISKFLSWGVTALRREIERPVS